MIDARHRTQLATDGYTVIERLVPDDVVQSARRDALSLFPAEADVRADPSRHRLVDGLLFRMFPYESTALNDIPFGDDVLDLAESVFEGRRPFLTQHLLRASFGGLGDTDQHLHRDYTDNSLLVPSDDPAYAQLAFLVYLTDVTVDDAPLHVCSRVDTDDRPLWPRERTRGDDPALYSLERPVTGPAGTAIAYTMSTFHRGSRFRLGRGFRLALHFILRPAGNEWMAFTAMPLRFDNDTGRRCIASLTPRQRSTLGIPLPGDPYWNPTTIEATAARYPGFDTGPYTAALRR